jgi:hypothetical protein
MRIAKGAARLLGFISLPFVLSACSSSGNTSTDERASSSVHSAGFDDAPPEARLGFGTLADLARLSDAQSRSVSPENFTGEKGKGGAATEGTGKGAARELGQGWKVSPSVRIKAHETFTLADISASGCINHIWMTPTGNWRHEIIRFYWDGEDAPSVEAPVGDFFACGLGQYAQVSSPPVCVNPGSAFNCYWPMPFHKSAKITLENIDEKDMVLYYQVDYAQSKIPADAAYFHAQFRMESPVKTKGLYTLLEGVKGKGQYVGTYMTYQTHGSGWWGEGEMKFYIDGDDKFPTICTTGTEDYFCGSYDFEDRQAHRYVPFSTPYTGLIQVIPPDKVYVPEQKFGLYRWHITDPVRFNTDLKVQIQDLGWQSGGRYAQLQDSISTVSFWYQTLPHAPFPPMPHRDELDRH